MNEVLKKYDWRTWTRFIWLRMVTNSGILPKWYCRLLDTDPLATECLRAQTAALCCPEDVKPTLEAWVVFVKPTTI